MEKQERKEYLENQSHIQNVSEFFERSPKKWGKGNCWIVTIPKHMVKENHIEENDPLFIIIDLRPDHKGITGGIHHIRNNAKRIGESMGFIISDPHLHRYLELKEKYPEYNMGWLDIFDVAVRKENAKRNGKEMDVIENEHTKLTCQYCGNVELYFLSFDYPHDSTQEYKCPRCKRINDLKLKVLIYPQQLDNTMPKID